MACFQALRNKLSATTQVILKLHKISRLLTISPPPSPAKSPVFLRKVLVLPRPGIARSKHTEVILLPFVCFRKVNLNGLVFVRQHKILRSSWTCHRELFLFLALVLIALGILAYYFGTTQYFTVQGKAHYLIVSEKQLLLLKKLLNR